MNYWLLRQDARLDHWKVRFIEAAPLDALRAGTPLDEPDEPVRVTLSAVGPEPSDFLELPCPIVSDAMRRALDRAGVDNVQYFRAVMRMDLSDEPVPDYWVANVVGTVLCAQVESGPDLVSAADLERGFDVDPASARGAKLFRLGEDPQLLVIDDQAAEALRAAELRGLVLQHTRAYAGRPISTEVVEPGAGFRDADLTGEDASHA